MIIFRYLVKEVLTSLAALTSILLLIFLSNQFVHYLSRAAAGDLPGIVVMKLMMLEIPNLLGLLLPLGFYVAVLVAYGRLYAESEMTVLQACGYSPGQLLQTTMLLAVIVAIIVGALMIWVSPIIATDRKELISGGGVAALIQTISPQRIRTINGGKRVFYVGNMSRDHATANNIFFAEQSSANKNQAQGWNIIWAKQGYSTQQAHGEQFIVLQDGYEYQGQPGTGAFRVASFAQYRARLPQQQELSLKNKVSTLPTAQLWPLNNPDLQKAAELQWRLSVPLMTLVLGLLAVPLSKVNPRQGKFAKILPAVIIYIIYANLMFVSRDWIIAQRIPVWLGMWWLHGVVLILALVLLLPKMRNS